MTRPAESGSAPNVLMIVVDQQRYDCLGHTNPGLVATPNLDQLALDGVRFTRAFTHIPTCCPARQSLLHGGRPETFGGLWNYDAALPIPAIPEQGRYWTHEIQRQGYDSAYLGKWHVHPTLDPKDFGYDEYIGLEDYTEHRRATGLSDVPSAWSGGTDPAPLAESRTHWFAQKAADWLTRREPGRPWHARVDFVEPHLPCTPTSDFVQRYVDREIEPWGNFDDSLEGKPYIQRQHLLSWGVEDWSWREWSEVVRRYLAVIEQLDDAIGIILDALHQTGQADDTLVVYTTDHGDLCGAHGMMDKHYVMYDEIVHVPLILRWPNRLTKGLVVNSFVYNILDLVPTLWSTLGCEIPSECVGHNILEMLENDSIRERDAVVATYNGQQMGLFTQRMLRTSNWKYIWNATDIDELYDLRADPFELTNLIHRPENAGDLAALRLHLADELATARDRQVSSEWVRRQLIGGRKR